MTKNNHPSENISSKNIVTAFSSSKRLMIWTILLVYREKSLTDLSELMVMSKSALHHHLKILRDTNLVHVSRTENVRGSINKKYFSLTKGSHRFLVDDLKEIKDSNQKFNMMKSMTRALHAVFSDLKFKINLAASFTEDFEKKITHLDIKDINKDLVDELHMELTEHNTKLKYIAFTDKQYKLYKQIEEDYLKKIENLRNQDDMSENSNLVILLNVPIKNLVQYTAKNNKESLEKLEKSKSKI